MTTSNLEMGDVVDEPNVDVVQAAPSTSSVRQNAKRSAPSKSSLASSSSASADSNKQMLTFKAADDEEDRFQARGSRTRSIAEIFFGNRRRSYNLNQMVFLDKKWKPFLNPLVDFRTYQVPTFLVFNNHFQYFLLSILEELSSYSDNIFGIGFTVNKTVKQKLWCSLLY